MLTESEKEAIDKGMIVLWIIWAAMLISLFIYALVCHQVEENIREKAAPDFSLDLLRNILFIVSIIELIISFFLRKAALAIRPASAFPLRPTISTSSTQPLFIAKYSVAMIIALALSESIGIYGMVLFFLGDSFRTLYTFIGVAAAAMILYRPKKEEIITLCNDMKMKVS